MTPRLSEGLYNLTEAISKVDPENVAHGFLGGAFGYGAHFENDVFEMRPFYWGDCDCEDTYPQPDEWEITHSPDCHVDQPNFLHKRTGFWVKWYKYIGRSMEWDESITKEDWREVYNECMDSLKEVSDEEL